MIELKVRLRSNTSTGFLSMVRIRDFRARRQGPVFRWAFWLLMAALVLIPVSYELRTSALQSWVLSSFARKMSFKVEPGPSPNIVFPKYGPFDIRAGYALIPEFEKRLHAAGYQTVAQARFSPALERASKWGILPPYEEPTSTRLTIHGEDKQSLFQAPVRGQYFSSFEEIPDLTVKSLLIIENRELADPYDSRTNPVVDWNRLAKAALLYTGNKLGLPVSVEGGSTLATQMEKYRHSYEGRTNSILAKLRQITGASLKVYQNGPDTREVRRQIVLDYLNSIPLSAAPGYGELNGIGNGLEAWFGLSLEDVRNSLALPDSDPAKAKAFKHVMALLCSVKAPSYYLLQNRQALEARANFYTQLLSNLQVISQDFASRTVAVPLQFASRRPERSKPSYSEQKAVNGIRTKLSALLGLPGMYELDRLHLDVESTIDPVLQQKVQSLFQKLHDPDFIDSAGLRGERLLGRGDPSKVIYGMMLFEKTPGGNHLRVVTDNLNAPFDINTGMKMQLGSTAKLRTLVNYLNIVADLHGELSQPGADPAKRAKTARDPITRWAAETLAEKPGTGLEAFLQLALDRKYSAGTGEAFFTGGGLHTFHNFNSKDGGRIVTVREATVHSINLPYIRLMRDLVRYYEARLPYDSAAVLSNYDDPIRQRMLQEIADAESRSNLYRFYKEFQKRTPDEIVRTLLGKKADSDRHLAILYYAWNRGGDTEGLERWLRRYLGSATPEQAQKLAKAYSNPRLNLSDYGYLLGMHPLRVWSAIELARNPGLEWERLWDSSTEARRISDAWLFKTRNRPAQDRRLRTRIEQDAFVRMTPHWQRLGFPFEQLVPSLATSIGSSGDRPEALAQLMGILLNDGVKMPTIRMSQLRFAAETPYETVLAPAPTQGTRVMPKEVARAILPILADVVERGTAVRMAGAFKVGDRRLVVGGKTGSGDNRHYSFSRSGGVIGSQATDRTALFVFYIEDRYFGIITVFVPGREAEKYSFTSSLPAAILKLLAPDIQQRLWPQPKAAPPGKGIILASNPVPGKPAAARPRPAAEPKPVELPPAPPASEGQAAQLIAHTEPLPSLLPATAEEPAPLEAVSGSTDVLFPQIPNPLPVDNRRSRSGKHKD